jgi:hypothetical protein
MCSCLCTVDLHPISAFILRLTEGQRSIQRRACFMGGRRIHLQRLRCPRLTDRLLPVHLDLPRQLGHQFPVLANRCVPASLPLGHQCVHSDGLRLHAAVLHRPPVHHVATQRGLARARHRPFRLRLSRFILDELRDFCCLSFLLLQRLVLLLRLPFQRLRLLKQRLHPQPVLLESGGRLLELGLGQLLVRSALLHLSLQLGNALGLALDDVGLRDLRRGGHGVMLHRVGWPAKKTKLIHLFYIKFLGKWHNHLEMAT